MLKSYFLKNYHIEKIQLNNFRPVLQIMQSGDEYGAESQEEEGNEDVVSEGVRIRKKFIEFKNVWPHRFDSQSVEPIHGLNRNAQSSFIRIKLGDWKDINHTWLINLELCDLAKDDYWIKEKLEKLSKYPYFPSIDKKMIFPNRLPVNFPSRVVENYFTAPQFSKTNTKVTVPSLIFGVDSMKLPLSDDPLFEFYGRQSIFECQITHELLLLENDIAGTITDLIDKLSISDENVEKIIELKESVKLLKDANALARASNFRAKSFSITSSCKAKLNMRDALLSKVKGEDYIKNALRGSCFLYDEIFGPIPENVQTKIDSFSSRSDAKLLPSSNFKKRSGDFLPKRGNLKKRGTASKQKPQTSNYNYNSNFNPGYNYDYGYGYPSTSFATPNMPPMAQQSLFQDRPRTRGARGKNRKGRGSKH